MRRSEVEGAVSANASQEPEVQVLEVSEAEPISARAPMIVPSERPPAPLLDLDKIVEHAPWPIERLERFTGSRWRFFATLTLVTLVGLLVRERADVARAVKNALRKNPNLLAASMKSVDEAPAKATEGPCPDEMGLVTRDAVRVCVDKYEASLVEILPDGEERAWSPYMSVDGHVVKAVSKAATVPQGYIDRDSAQAACESAGKRLCHQEEWIAACEGPERTQYPYGATADEDACNIHGKSPLGELFSTSFRDHLFDFRVMNDPSLNAVDGTVAKTGAFAKCVNGFGLHDMVGNLHEWTAETKGVFRGGYYQDAHKNGEGCRYATSAHLPTYHDYSTGFRCCKDAE